MSFSEWAVLGTTCHLYRIDNCNDDDDDDDDTCNLASVVLWQQFSRRYFWFKQFLVKVMKWKPSVRSYFISWFSKQKYFSNKYTFIQRITCLFFRLERKSVIQLIVISVHEILIYQHNFKIIHKFYLVSNYPFLRNETPIHIKRRLDVKI